MASLNKFCPKCKKWVNANHKCYDKQGQKAYNTFVRDKASDKFYHSAAWLKVRKLVLAREPFCRACGMPASDIDHITPIKDGGDKLSLDNLQPLCKACHNKKTTRERRGRGGKISAPIISGNGVGLRV